MAPQLDGLEKTVTPKSPMPKGYALLKKGNAYRTSLCKRKTIDAKKPLYIVKDKSKIVGVRAPKWILSQVFAEDRETKDRRRAVVAGRDSHAKTAFEAAIKAQFSIIPDDEAGIVAEKALKKRSGRVGRTSTLSLETKARLAVLAHIRHCHTNYDQLVEKKGKDEARKQVHAKILSVARKWGLQQANQRRQGPRLARTGPRRSALKRPMADEDNSEVEVIDISDDSDDSAVELWEEESSGAREGDEDEKDAIDAKEDVIFIDSDSDD